MDIPVQKLPLKPSDCFQNITGFCIYFKTISLHSSTENCGLGCAPAIFVQFFCFLLQSSVPVLGFTYRKAQAHYRILDYVRSVIIPLFELLTVKSRFSRFQQKVAQCISRLHFQLCITFVLDYRFTWNKR